MRIFPAASLRSESTTPATSVRRRRRQRRTRLVCRPTWVMTPLHGQVRGLNSFYVTWLTTIVPNAALMKLRRRDGYLSLDEEQGEDGLTFSERLPDSKPSPEELCSAAEARDQLVEGVRQLSPKLRRTFQLRDIDGLTTKEAALILGVPPGTVKAQLARARAKLAGMIRGKPIRLRSRTVSVGKAVSTKGAPSENSIWEPT